MTREIRVETNQRGAGYYGAPAPSHVTRCHHSNNGIGHSDQCPCGVLERRVAVLVKLGAVEEIARDWVKRNTR